MSQWHSIGRADEVDEDEPMAATVGDKAIGVYKVGEQFYALEDICPHAFAHLTQGFVEGDEVECPLHQALFHIPTGKCLREPAERDLKTYDVKVEDGTIYVRA